MTRTPAGVVEAAALVAAGDVFSLDLPPDAASIRTARLFAAAVARHFGTDEESVEDVKLAISEACTNAVKAHQAAKTEDPVTVRAVAGLERLTFEVSDGGAGFLPPSDAATTPPTGLYEGSLGLTLIRSLFPAAEIQANLTRGMTVRFWVNAGSRTTGSD